MSYEFFYIKITLLKPHRGLTSIAPIETRGNVIKNLWKEEIL